jgi:hypothetical protein
MGLMLMVWLAKPEQKDIEAIGPAE